MIPAQRAHLHVAAASHPGMSGKNNEDRYGISAYRLGPTDRTPSVFAIVADGIGGHKAGELAAELAVETISQQVAASDASTPTLTLQQAIIAASQVISARSEADPDSKGMGSTCACAWVIGSRLYTASVGDSRIYLLRKDTIRQLTTDHTWVQEAIEQGLLQPEQARSHPNAHVIRRYLGSRNGVIPDLRLRMRPDEDAALTETNQGAHLQAGDILLLCSDGLTDLVDDHEILAAIRTDRTGGALQTLVDLVNQRGGHDNVTILTLAVPEDDDITLVTSAKPAPVPQPQADPPPRPTGSLRPTAGRWRLAGCLVFALIVGIVLSILAGVYWFSPLRRADRTPTPIAQPGVQGTLFPPGAPSLEASTPARTPQVTPGSVLPDSEATLMAQPSTLTPWPTNTPSP